MGTFDGDAEREEEGLIAEAVRDTLLVEATLASNASDMSKDEYGEKKDMLPERVCYQVRVLSALSVVLVVAGMIFVASSNKDDDMHPSQLPPGPLPYNFSGFPDFRQ